MPWRSKVHTLITIFLGTTIPSSVQFGLINLQIMCQIQIVSKMIGVNIGEGCYKMIRCDKNRGGLLRKCVVIRFREGYCSTSEFKKEIKTKLCNLTYPFFNQFLL